MSSPSANSETHFASLRWLILVAASVVAAYSNSLSVPFVFDDIRNITANEDIRQLRPQPDKASLGLSRRPVGRLTLVLNYACGRLNVWGYHVFNLAVHCAGTLFLFGLLKSVLLRQEGPSKQAIPAAEIAFGCALLWGLHPLQTQSVTYVIQRLESLAGMFQLAALYFLVLGVRSPNSWLWYAISLVAFSLGIGTKETVAVLPLISLLLDRIFLAESWAEIARRRWGYYLGFLPPVLWLASQLTPQQGNFAYMNKGVTSWEYFISQPEVIWHYLRLAVWPDQLCFDYNWPIATNWWTIAACGVPLIVLLGASCWALFRWPRIGFLGMTFFLTLAPSSSIVPIADLAYEHRMYLPLAPLTILTVLVLYQVCNWLCRTELQSVRAMMAITCILALLLGARTWQRNRDWANPRKLWESNVAIAPQSYRAQANLAMILREAGETERAISHLQKSIAIKPTAVAYRNLGLIHRDRRELDQAEECFLRALQDRPSYAPASLDLARLFSESQKWPQAVSYFQATLALEPKSPIDIIDRAAVLDELGSALARSGDLPAAIHVFRQAVTAEPRFAAGYLHLAMASLDQGDLSTASDAARTLLRLKPDSKAGQQLIESINAKMTQE